MNRLALSLGAFIVLGIVSVQHSNIEIVNATESELELEEVTSNEDSPCPRNRR